MPLSKEQSENLWAIDIVTFSRLDPSKSKASLVASGDNKASGVREVHPDKLEHPSGLAGGTLFVFDGEDYLPVVTGFSGSLEIAEGW